MGVSSVGGIGSYQQPYTTPLSSGPAAAQQTQRVENPQEDEAERTRQQQQQSQSTTTGGGNTTPTRGQNLNISV